MTTRQKAIILGVLLSALLGFLTVPSNAADKVKVKAGAMLSLSCPGDGVERGGTITWFDKRDVSLGTVSGVVVDGTVRFGPAPRKVEYGVAQLDCAAPPTTTSTTTTTVAPTTTSTSTTTSTTLPPTTTSTTTTTLPPTTTSTTTTTTLPDPNTYLTGTAVLFGINDSLGRYLAIIYGLDFVGLPLYPGSDPPTVRACPSGTALNFAASTFTVNGLPIGASGPVTVTLFPSGNPAILAENHTTATVTIAYRIVCVPA